MDTLFPVPVQRKNGQQQLLLAVGSLARSRGETAILWIQ